MKNSLNQEFYKWIDDVRRALRKKGELDEQLKEYERRLVGYNAVSYDLIGARGEGISAEGKILNALYEMERVSKKIKSMEYLTGRFNKVFSNLTVREKNVLYMLVHSDYNTGKIINKLNISKNRFYSIIYMIIRKWNKTS